MTSLAKDIEAVLSITRERDREVLRPNTIGFLKVFGGGYIEMEDVCFPGEKIDLRKDIEKLFCKSDETARIALVFACGTEFREKIWDIVQDLSFDNIAGVLILKGTSDQGRGSVGFLNSLPEKLWNAALPILHDASALLSMYSPKSKKVACDSRLMFMRMEDYESYFPDYIISDFGVVSELRQLDLLPMYDASGLENDVAYARMGMWSAICSLSFQCSFKLYRQLSHYKKWDPIGNDPESVISFLNDVVSGSVNTELFSALKVIERPEEIANPVVVNRHNSPEYRRLYSLYENMENATSIIVEALKRHIPQNKDGEYIEDLDLCEFLKAIGVGYQIEALRAGVPIEDVLA